MRKIRTRAPLQLQQATARCAFCAVMYWAARFAADGLRGRLSDRWLNGAGVGAPPVVWQLVQWCGVLVGGIVALTAPVVVAAVLWPGRFRLRVRPARSPMGVLALPVYLGAAQLVGVAAALVFKTTGSGQQIVLPDTLPALVVAFVALCLMPAVLEELLFRGLAQGLVRPYGGWAAVVAQAVLFALLHGNLSGVLYALPAGLFFGWLAEQTGSILPGMLLHFCNNTLSFVLLLLQSMGYSDLASVVSLVCLVAFPLWAVAALLATRKNKRFAPRPLKAGTRPAALLGCKEWRFVVLILTAAAVVQAVFA